MKSIKELWDNSTTATKWVVGYFALIAVIGVMGAVADAIKPDQPAPPKPMAARKLTDAEVQAKWDAQMNELSRGTGSLSRQATDAWDAAKRKLKRAWIEGQGKEATR